MHSLSVGMKIYDNRWFLGRGLSPEAAADFLKDMGVTWVIAQSRLLPMADSAVESAVRQTDTGRYAALDDLGFRNLLRDRGIAAAYPQRPVVEIGSVPVTRAEIRTISASIALASA